MKLSVKLMAFIYFTMGVLFTYLAIKNVNMSGWNIISVLFTFVAALDFGVSYRYVRHYLLNKNSD